MTTRRGLFALMAGAVALPLAEKPPGRVVHWLAFWDDEYGWVLSYTLDYERVENVVCVGKDDAEMASVAAMINDHYARTA